MGGCVNEIKPAGAVWGGIKTLVELPVWLALPVLLAVLFALLFPLLLAVVPFCVADMVNDDKAFDCHAVTKLTCDHMRNTYQRRPMDDGLPYLGMVLWRLVLPFRLLGRKEVYTRHVQASVGRRDPSIENRTPSLHVITSSSSLFKPNLYNDILHG